MKEKGREDWVLGRGVATRVVLLGAGWFEANGGPNREPDSKLESFFNISFFTPGDMFACLIARRRCQNVPYSPSPNVELLGYRDRKITGEIIVTTHVWYWYGVFLT